MLFQTPYFLLLLLIAFGFFIHSVTKVADPLKNIMRKELRAKLFLSQQLFTPQSRYYLFLLVIALFIVALARPVKLLSTLDVTQNRPSVVLAIDVSRSMKKNDIYPSREAFAKAKAQTFIEKALGFNIGLIFYANDAYMLYPLSQERELLLTLLKDANITQKFAPNSNLFSALEASNFLLKKHQNRHIILLTDGGKNISREEELAYLKSKSITLSTLAITPKINRAMQSLCKGSRGLYQPYEWSQKDVTQLIEHINSSAKSSEKVHLKLPQYKEYFTYPLTLALVLLILFFLPIQRITLILFLFYIQPPSLHAGVLDFWHINQAQKAINENNYTKAIEKYLQVESNVKVEYNLAYALYKSEKYNEAIKHYQKILGLNKKMDAKVYYNIATAYARQNKLKFAKESYEKSFELNPTKITQENLQTVTLALKKQRKNLHKKYEKLTFKAIGENAYSQNSAFSNYAIKLHKFMPSEEEKWFQKVAKQRPPTYLQKIKTTQRSLDANLSQ